MSEALQKMVAAMAAELKRQDEDWARYLDENPWMKDEPAPGSEGYNLEKVARAGLVAIKEPSEDVAKAGLAVITHDPETVDMADTFDAMVDKILE